VRVVMAVKVATRTNVVVIVVPVCSVLLTITLLSTILSESTLRLVRSHSSHRIASHGMASHGILLHFSSNLFYTIALDFITGFKLLRLQFDSISRHVQMISFTFRGGCSSGRSRLVRLPESGLREKVE
jgi:Na+/H+ antiporter NhaC